MNCILVGASRDRCRREARWGGRAGMKYQIGHEQQSPSEEWVFFF